MASNKLARDGLGAGALALGAVFAVALVPRAAWSGFGVPETHAVYGFLFMLPLIAVLRALGRARVERACLALFLGAMPLIYLGAALRTHCPLAVELVGCVLFAAVAVAGVVTSPWLLVVGIAAHGLAWDLWHTHGLVVQAWYAPACAVIDAAVAVYAATRVPAWRLAQSRAP